MEFGTKLQQLRKQKGMTQEELAEMLFVSRAAVSKWESCRGYPNIESLKAISALFSVSIDSLLSNEEILFIAHEDGNQKQQYVQNLLFALLDISVCILFFIPMFAQNVNGDIHRVSLLNLTYISPVIKTIYIATIAGITASGIAALIIKSHKVKIAVSFFFNITGVLVFILSPQPYAAAFLFVFLVIKAVVMIKKQRY